MSYLAMWFLVSTNFNLRAYVLQDVRELLSGKKLPLQSNTRCSEER